MRDFSLTDASVRALFRGVNGDSVDVVGVLVGVRGNDAIFGVNLLITL